MSNGEYPVEPEVTVALLRLEKRLIERLTRLETKMDTLTAATPTQSGTTTRASAAGAIAAGAVLGLTEAIRRFLGS